MVTEVLGWVVAGAITVAGTVLGVWFLGRLQESSRERREVLSPVYEEVGRLVEWGPEMVGRSGYPPTFGAEFETVVKSGLLRLKRHDALRRDVDTFRRLRDETHETAQRLRSVAYDAMGDLYAKIGLEVPSGGLVKDLTGGNKDDWVEDFKRLSPNQRNPLMEIAAPDQLYEDVRGAVDEARAPHHEKAKELLSHAGHLQEGLQKAMRTFRGRYKRGGRS